MRETKNAHPQPHINILRSFLTCLRARGLKQKLTSSLPLSLCLSPSLFYSLLSLTILDMGKPFKSLTLVSTLPLRKRFDARDTINRARVKSVNGSLKSLPYVKLVEAKASSKSPRRSYPDKIVRYLIFSLFRSPSLLYSKSTSAAVPCCCIAHGFR